MDASVEVMFLVIVVAVSTVYAFTLEVRRGLENDRFVEWLKIERKSDWDALTRADRLLTVRAVEMLRHGALADDDEFNVRYQSTRHGIRFAAAMSVAGAGIALVPSQEGRCQEPPTGASLNDILWARDRSPAALGCKVSVGVSGLAPVLAPTPVRLGEFRRARLRLDDENRMEHLHVPRGPREHVVQSQGVSVEVTTELL